MLSRGMHAGARPSRKPVSPPARTLSTRTVKRLLTAVPYSARCLWDQPPMLLVRAVFAVLESGPRTPDLGGTNTTMDVTNAILAKLKTY